MNEASSYLSFLKSYESLITKNLFVRSQSELS